MAVRNLDMAERMLCFLGYILCYAGIGMILASLGAMPDTWQFWAMMVFTCLAVNMSNRLKSWRS